MLLLSCAPTVQSPVSNAGGFFYGCVSNVGQGVVSNFLEIFMVGVIVFVGGCVVGVKYYRSAENRWGIVFSATRSLSANMGWWGYGGV